MFHAPLIAATPELRLATIVTANPERAERARRDHPDARVAGIEAAIESARSSRAVEQVGRVLVDTEGAGVEEFVLAVAAGEQPTPSAPARRAASRSQTLSPTTTVSLMATPSRSAAARNRSGSGLA